MSDNSDAKAEPDRGPSLCYLIALAAQPPDEAPVPNEAPVAWLIKNASGWHLPSLLITNRSGFPTTAEPIRQGMAAEFAVDARVLCHIHEYWPPGGGQETMVAVVEVVRGSLPPEWHPLTADDVRSARFAVPEHRDLLERWLRSSMPGAVPAERAAWARPGWRARVNAWINQQLAALGMMLAGPITVQKIWSISCVLRVPTSTGDFYFKAVPPLFGREPALTDALARRHPGQVPEVVALDTAQGWMLMRGFAGSMLREIEDLAVWEDALRAYARLQIAWRDDLEALRRLGCQDRGPLRLAQHIDELLADDAVLWVGQPRGLTSAQAAELRALAPRLKAACAEWAAAGVPLTLEHGDYHADNVAVNAAGSGERFIVFDWTDGCIAHPFVCLPALLENAKPEWHAALTRAYLESWREIASPAQLETALRLARPLAALQMAVSYYDIHHAGEPMVRWQLGGAPYFLGVVLKHQENLSNN